MTFGTRADTTIDPAHPHAYGANVGWIDARGDITNGAVIGRFYCSGHMWSANCGWIKLGAGTPTNGWQYTNASGSDWGVNHDGEGRLDGCAYGENIGWVVFEQLHGCPRVDLRSGCLSGYAWGANIGWVGLSNTVAHVRTERLDSGPDDDGDGVPDPWEYARTGTTNVLDGGVDSDHDGATDAEEFAADTNPLDDGDSLRITAFARNGSTSAVEWTCRPTRLYRLEEATNGLGVGWVDAGPGLLSPPPALVMERDVQADAEGRYYRVRAIVPGE